MPRLLVVIAALGLGACAPPAEGDPCEPNPYAPRADYRSMLLQPTEELVEFGLFCTGPAGCASELAFTYRWSGYDDAWPPVCACDGRTYYFTTAPRVRWRYAGVCGGCRDARTDAFGNCVGADGTSRLASCCDCSLDEALHCVAMSGEPVDEECCATRLAP